MLGWLAMVWVAWSGVSEVEDLPPAEEEEAEAPGPVRYDLDPERSDLWVLLRYDRSAALSGAMGNDHVIAATGWRGQVTWDVDDPSACAVHITVPVEGLTVDPPGARDRAGLEGDTSERNRGRIADNMWGRRQLHASSFPEITFEATRCQGTTGTVPVHGELSIRGMSRPVEVEMTVEADGSSFSAEGALDITHTAFGFDPFTNVMGALRNDDRLTLHVEVRGAAR